MTSRHCRSSPTATPLGGRDDSQILEALRHGRLALFVGLDRITADVEAEVRAFDAEREEFVDGLATAGLSPTRPT